MTTAIIAAAIAAAWLALDAAQAALADRESDAAVIGHAACYLARVALAGFVVVLASAWIAGRIA